VSYDLNAWKRAWWRKYLKCTMAAKLNTLKKCVMAVPADVGKPTRKVAGVRVKE